VGIPVTNPELVGLSWHIKFEVGVNF